MRLHESPGKLCALALLGFLSMQCLGVSSPATDITESPGSALFLLLASGLGSGGSNTVTRTKYVYVSYRTDNNIRILQLDHATGGLTEVAGSPVGTGAEPIGVCIHPTQKFLYVAERGANVVSGYSIDATTGQLTLLAGSPYTAGTQPWDCEVHPNGNFLYVANFGAGSNLSLYSIDPTTGVPTGAGTLASGGNTSQSLAFSSDGGFLFASHTSSTNVTVHTVNPTTGALTAVGGSPFASGTFMRQLALTPSQNFLYVPSRNDSNYRIYSVASGVLTETGASPFGGIGQVMAAAVSPDGKFLYTGQQTANNITGYSLNATNGNPTALVLAPTAVSFPQTLYFEPGGTYLFSLSSSASGNLNVFTWNTSTGELTNAAGSPHGFGASPHQAAFLTETIAQ